jgi:hypothetical protein
MTTTNTIMKLNNNKLKPVVLRNLPAPITPSAYNHTDTKVLTKLNKAIIKDTAWYILFIAVYIPILIIVMSMPSTR